MSGTRGVGGRIRSRVLVISWALTCVAGGRAAAETASDSLEVAHAPTEANEASQAAIEAPGTSTTATARHAPRAYGFTLGYAVTPRNDLPLSATVGSHRPMGLAAEFRYGWQVGGLDGSAPAWVGFSTSFFAHTRGSPRSSLGIDYGLFVRHAVFVRPSVRGFFGYGLGATQVFVSDVGGRGIGHMTNLNVGVDLRLRGQLLMTFEVSYRFVILPSFETALEPTHRYDFHSLRIVGGLFFGG